MPSPRACPRCAAPISEVASDALCPVCLLETALGEPFPAEPELIPAHPSANGPSRLPEPPAQLRYFGDYELIGELARGGMGVVYLARQTTLDRLVAVKLLLYGGFSSPGFVERFRTEAAAAGRLQHPGIVAIHEIGEHAGQHFFSMDYVPGENLAQRVARQPPSAVEAATLLLEVTQAVRHAHELDVLHRDLKPANVLVDLAGHARVTDFGLAKRLDRGSELTATGEVVGSPCFMAPEQITGESEPVGVRADVYGLGAILYHMLTSRPPFQASTVAATLELVLRSDPVSPRSLNPTVPRDLETICLKCLAKRPVDRYLDTTALAEDLSRFLRHEPIAARPVGPLERSWRWARRHPARAGLLAAGMAFLVALATGGWAYGQQRESARVQESRLRQDSERQRYDLSINLASRAWTDGDFTQADRLLAGLIPKPGEPDRRGWEWYNLRHELRDQEERQLWNGTNEIHHLAASRDGNRVALISADELILLTVTNGAVVARWTVPESTVDRLPVFTPDGGAVVVGSMEGAIWYQPGTAPRELLHEPANVLAFSPDGTWLAFSSTSPARNIESEIPVGLLNLTTGRIQQRREQDGGPGLHWTIEPGGDATAPIPTLWILGSRAQLTRWGPDSEPKPVWNREHFTDFAIFNPAARRVVYDDIRGFLVWGGTTNAGPANEPAPGRLRLNWSATRPVMAFSADGSRVVAKNGADRRIAVCDPITGQIRSRLSGHRGELTGLTFLGQGTKLVSASRDGTVRLWDLENTNGNFRVANRIVRFAIPNPVFSQDSTKVALTTRYRDTNDLFSIISLPGMSKTDATSGFPLFHSQPDDAFIFWKISGEVHAWHTDTAKDHKLYFPGGSHIYNWDIITPDGRFLIVEEAQSVRVAYETQTNTKYSQFPTNASFFVSSIDGSQLAFMAPEGVCVWSKTNRLTSVLIGRDSASMAFSPDGHFLAVGDIEGKLTVIQISTKQIRHELTGHGGEVNVVAYSPDGRTIVSGGEDRTLRWWNAETGTALQTRSTPENIHWLSFSPNQEWLVVGWAGAYEFLRAPGIPAAGIQRPVQLLDLKQFLQPRPNK